MLSRRTRSTISTALPAGVDEVGFVAIDRFDAEQDFRATSRAWRRRSALGRHCRNYFLRRRQAGAVRRCRRTSRRDNASAPISAVLSITTSNNRSRRPGCARPRRPAAGRASRLPADCAFSSRAREWAASTAGALSSAIFDEVHLVLDGRRDRPFGARRSQAIVHILVCRRSLHSLIPDFPDGSLGGAEMPPLQHLARQRRLLVSRSLRTFAAILRRRVCNLPRFPPRPGATNHPIVNRGGPLALSRLLRLPRGRNPSVPDHRLATSPPSHTPYRAPAPLFAASHCMPCSRQASPWRSCARRAWRRGRPRRPGLGRAKRCQSNERLAACAVESGACAGCASDTAFERGPQMRRRPVLITSP